MNNDCDLKDRQKQIDELEFQNSQFKEKLAKISKE